MSRAILLLLLAFIYLAGCRQQHPCVKNSINPAFVNFSLSEIDTFVLRAYQPNDNYQHLVDTLLVTNRYTSIYTATHDTTIVYINDSDPDHWISSGLDWQVYIPATNTTVAVSGITETPVDGPGRICYNPVTSFKQDGQLVVPALLETGQFYTSGYRLYIQR